MSDTFNVPDAFRVLYYDGRLDYWGGPFPADTPTRERLLQERRWEVLWWSSIEWEPDATPESIAGFGGDGQLRPGLFPFAGDGSGDRFCFYPRWQGEGADVPVVLFRHDALESALFARSFGECLGRAMLLHYAEELATGEDPLEETADLYRAHLAIVAPYLPVGLREAMQTASARPDADEVAAVERALACEIPERSLIGALQPTRYRADLIKRRDDLVRLYRNSERLYRELVEDEGREEYRTELAAVRAELDRLEPG